jgi:hypothetical protein
MKPRSNWGGAARSRSVSGGERVRADDYKRPPPRAIKRMVGALGGRNGNANGLGSLPEAAR